jgi:hypothetical protein
MDLDNLRNTWEKQDGVADTSIEINQSLLSSIKVNQQMEKLRKVQFYRILESVCFFFIVLSLWHYILKDFTFSAPTISAIILNFFAIIGLAGNIGQIVLIAQCDYSAPVKKLQHDMYRICAHKLQLTKLAMLSLPLYMTYTFFGLDALFGVDLYQQLSEKMVVFYAVSTVIIFAITAWVLSRLTYKNITSPWVKWSIAYIVGEQLIDMAEFLNSAETA